MNEIEISQLNNAVEHKSPSEIIEYFLDYFPNEITFGTSLGAEDQLITDLLVKSGKPFKIFTLDTGRLFPESYDLIDRTNKKYGIKIRLIFPDSQQVESMVNNFGINLFYDSIENRKMCCKVRKLMPLEKVLEGNKAWFTGLRKSQSVTRNQMKIVEFDSLNSMIKVNPLIDFEESDVWDYLNKFNVPTNPLHKSGFASIGCQPCTRAIEKGEDIRAGRWWWESPENKECGLHKK
jgi:phosphoadenosine phosphosulfate reductase